VIQHLGRGADNARSIGSIAEDLGMAHRTVEKRLEELVKSGVPVVATNDSPKGVYLAQTPQEARQYADSLDGRIAAIAARSRALRAWADDQEYGEIIQTELGWVA
jgi:biotin operon repressor